ncbi:MAG: AmmeMemoRadiSam system protein A [Spirochaetes bacterium]|nr:AmmeMemoRadiSam system protein A [Spirochaetota bacterium]
MEIALTEEEKKLLLQVARQSVTNTLEGKPYDPPIPKGNLLSKAGVFVTIHTRNGNLRGCIGQLYGKSNLIETVKDVALSSAFHDPRFSPVKQEELKTLVFEISILSPFHLARPEDVVPGIHGIYLKNGFFSGLLLPQVATEQGWNRIQFLDHGCRKAGLSEGCWQDPNTELYIFTALVFSEQMQE